MKKWLSIVALLLIGFIAGCGFALYLCYFKTLDNDDILAYGWKGGGCGLPEVLDFRGGGMRLDGNTLYVGNTPRGRIVKREYRPLIEPVLEIASETGEICPFWGKWEN